MYALIFMVRKNIINEDIRFYGQKVVSKILKS